MVRSVVRIGDPLACAPLDMIEQERQLGSPVRRVQPSQVGEVLRVQRDDVVKTVEVLRRDLPRAIGGEVGTVAQARGDRPRVRSVADMPVTGTGAIDPQVEPEPLRLEPHRRFRHGRAADVAETDKQHRHLAQRH
jgi:hypothetical protein